LWGVSDVAHSREVFGWDPLRFLIHGSIESPFLIHKTDWHNVRTVGWVKGRQMGDSGILHSGGNEWLSQERHFCSEELTICDGRG